MSHFKYITEEILDKVLPYIQKRLNKNKEIKITLSDEEVLYLKREILDKCPLCLSNKFIPENSFEGFRIIVEYEGKINKAFEPQLIINISEREYVVKKYLIDQFLNYEYVPSLKDKNLDLLIQKICELLAVSLFGKLRSADYLAAKMKQYGKKVIEIRKGKLTSHDGKYIGNPFKGKGHVNWFPYTGIDEWSIFSEVVKKYSK